MASTYTAAANDRGLFPFTYKSMVSGFNSNSSADCPLCLFFNVCLTYLLTG